VATVWCLLEVSDDGELGVVSQRNDLLVDHKSEDTHHGGTAVVELDGTLLELGLLIKVIPAEVNVSVTEVTDEFVSGSWDVLHDGALQESNKGDHLDKTGGGDGVGADEGGDTVGERVEGVTGVVDGSWEVDSGTGDDLSKEGKHTDTSVLDLDETEAVEAIFILSCDDTEGIVEAKRRLGTKFVLEGVQAVVCQLCWLVGDETRRDGSGRGMSGC